MNRLLKKCLITIVAFALLVQPYYGSLIVEAANPTIKVNSSTSTTQTIWSNQTSLAYSTSGYSSVKVSLLNGATTVGSPLTSSSGTFNISTLPSQFTVKVAATLSGTTTTANFTIIRLPYLTSTISGPTQGLVGDALSYQLQLVPSSLTLSDTSFVLDSLVPNSTYTASGTFPDSIVSSAQANKTYTITPSVSGSISVKPTLNYTSKYNNTNSNTNSTVPSSGVNLSVRKANVTVDLKDSTTNATLAKPLYVQILKIKDAAGNSITPLVIATPQVINGQIIYGDDAAEILPSGSYKIVAVANTEFRSSQSQAFTVSYTNYNVTTSVNIENVKADGFTANGDPYVINILEVQPMTTNSLARTFVLSQAELSGATVTQISMREFIAYREEILGKYDIIYFGAEGGTYTALGAEVTNLPQGGTKSSTTTEYYSANDITHLKANEIKEFIAAGHLVVFDKRIFTTIYTAKTTPIIYTDFLAYNTAVPNNVSVQDGAAACKTFIQGNTGDFSAFKGKSVLRPYLAMVIEPTSPKQYDGTAANYQSSSIITFNFDALSFANKDNKFTINIYFDINGDAQYRAEDDERLKTVSGVKGNKGLSVTMSVPEGFTGLQPWKVEIVDESTNTINYKLGAIAFKGNTIKLNVLQVYPTGNTLDIKSGLSDSAGNSYLTSGEYIINVTKMTISDFNNLYVTNPNYSLVNSDYDMIIFGFNDMYGPNDISGKKVADDIKAFLSTGQSVMFTHDTTTFLMNNPSGWSYNFTKYLRDTMGQNIYVKESSDPTLKADNANYLYKDVPDLVKTTYGFSDGALLRANGGDWNQLLTSNVNKINDGLLTSYPYLLSNQTVPVAQTHTQYFQLNLEDQDVVVWYTLAGGQNNQFNPQSYYYTYSKGNVTYSGTGHSNLSTNISYQERQMFVNTIIKATRGSNLAPSVTVSGLQDNQNLSDTQQTLDISILATDPDIKDQMLNARVYLDNNGDRQYTDDEMIQEYNISNGTGLVNGITQPLAISLSNLLVKNIRDSGVKVVVFDGDSFGQGADASNEKKFNRVDIPVINTVLPSTKQILVGDEVVFNTVINLKVSDATANTNITNIGVKTTLAEKSATGSTALGFTNSKLGITLNAADWTNNGSYLTANIPSTLTNVKSSPSWTSKSVSFKVVANAVGTYSFNTKTNYDIQEPALLNQGTDQTFDLDVRKGQIGVSLKDDGGATVNVPVNIELIKTRDVNGNSLAVPVLPQKYTVPAGNMTIGNDAHELVSSGYYIIKAEATSGSIYGGATSSEILVDYSHASVPVVLELVNTPIVDISLNHDISAKQIYNADKIRYLNNNSAQVELSFTTTKDVEKLVLTLTNNYNLIVTPVSISSTDVDSFDSSKFTYISNKLTYIGGSTESVNMQLPKGTYKILLQVKLPATAVHKDTGLLGVSSQVNVSDIFDVLDDTGVVAGHIVVPKDYTLSVTDPIKFTADKSAPTITDKVARFELNEMTQKINLKTFINGTESNVVYARYLLNTVNPTDANFVKQPRPFSDFKNVDGSLKGNVFNTYTDLIKLPTVTTIKEVDNNHYYTVYTVDEAGNEAVQVIKIFAIRPKLL